MAIQRIPVSGMRFVFSSLLTIYRCARFKLIYSFRAGYHSVGGCEWPTWIGIKGGVAGPKPDADFLLFLL